MAVSSMMILPVFAGAPDCGAAYGISLFYELINRSMESLDGSAFGAEMKSDQMPDAQRAGVEFSFRERRNNWDGFLAL